MFKNKKFLWIVLLVVVVAASGGYYYFTTLAAEQENAAAENTLQTAVARRGDLIIYASASGEVVAAAEVAVGFDETGTLSELLVDLGDEVAVDQALAQLDTEATPEEIAAEVAQAQLEVLEAQKARDDLYKNAERDAALAQIAVEDAEAALEDLLNSDTQQAQAWEDYVAAQAAVEEAESTYYISQSMASQANIDAAWAQVILTENALERAQEKYEPFASKPDDNLTKANLQANLSAAQQNYDAAVRDYNAMTSTGSETDQATAAAELTTAQAQLADAERAWERAQEGPSAGEIALAEAELTLAQVEWDRLKDGPDPEDIAFAEAELANAQANLDLALDKQAIVTLLSPLAGTVIEISAQVGETLNANTGVITIADLNQPR